MAYHTQRRPVMNRVFVGMDVHKEKIVVVGLPEEGNHPLVREEFGGNDLLRLVKRLQRLAKTYGIEACYEAGPCGYGLARALRQAGMECRVAAPSLIPRRPGDRIKTEGRDGRELALALRAHTLSFVRIPTQEEEEVRGLVRCREDIAKEVRRIKQVISHWLLLHGHRVPKGVKSWTPAHRRWMRDLEVLSLVRTALDHYPGGPPACLQGVLQALRHAGDRRGDGVCAVPEGHVVYEVHGAGSLGTFLLGPDPAGKDHQGGQQSPAACPRGGGPEGP